MGAITIVPRWEWRCFAPSLGKLEQAIALPSDITPCESDETYILNLTGPISDNVKIRDGILDVKRLHQTDADGLELWEPVFKAHFPLDRNAVATAFAAWVPDPAALPRDSFTLEQLISDIVAPQPALRAIGVHKSRRSFIYDGCLAEFVALKVESVTSRSFSLEHEDPRRILAALRVLELDGHANTNYPRGLKRALGL